MDLLKNLDNMITAEEFINQEEYNGVEPSGYFHGEARDYFESKMIEFAKLHTVEILKKLSKTEMEYQRNIQHVYPLSNIK